MSYKQKKGAVQFEPPLDGCSFQNAVAGFPVVASKSRNNNRENARTPQKTPDKNNAMF
jgi:hypothetical protein